MRKIIIIAAAAVLISGPALAQTATTAPAAADAGVNAQATPDTDHTFTLTPYREQGLTAARNFINAQELQNDPMAATDGDPNYYPTNDAYAQHVMDGATDSYCNNVPNANCSGG